MAIVNKFLTIEDFERQDFQRLRKEFERVYIEVLKKQPETRGAKEPHRPKIHWSRDWEYPWAIINSGVEPGQKVLDCGCGGSPLLPYLDLLGCETYGADPNIFRKAFLPTYYYDLMKQTIAGFRSPGKTYEDCIKKSDQWPQNSLWYFLKSAFSLLTRPNNLWGYRTDPNKLPFKIRFFAEDLSAMHFEGDYFDRVFCISVIEHLPEDTAYQGMREMARVLKKGGLLTVTVDDEGPHVNPELAGKFRKLIKSSGLELYGESDFIKPTPEKVPGPFNVVGFILQK